MSVGTMFIAEFSDSEVHLISSEIVDSSAHIGMAN